MAAFELTIPDAQLTLVTDSLIKAAGGTPTGDPVTDAVTAKAAVIGWITATVANVQAASVPPPPRPATPVLGLS